MKFVPRAAWSALPPKTRTSLHAPSGVALHWNGPSLPLPDHARCADAVRNIQRYHMVTRRWADIAYSALVCPHGYVFEGRGLNTRTAANGTDLGNDRFYAICYLGGEGDALTDEARQGISDARAWLIRDGGAGPDVKPHSHFKATSCPGDALRDWLPALMVSVPVQPPALRVPPATPVALTVALPELRVGMDGKWVRKLQGLLVAHGHRIEVDADYGPATRAALVRHQTAHGLPATGVCDETSWRTLIEK